MNATNKINIRNDKKIAKNTLFLYFRMLIVSFVSLFVVRYILQILGVTDYGIYNIVAGVVIMFSFLSNTMATATQRFFSVDIGTCNNNLAETFSIAFYIYSALSCLLFILAETFGLYFIKHHIEIPPDRYKAGLFIYQTAVLGFVFMIMSTPYKAIITAREDMGIFAYIGILEVALKVFSVVLLYLIPYDKLILYGLLMLFSSIVLFFVHAYASLRKYKECRLLLTWNKKTFFSLISFSSWNMIGALANIIRLHGVNILINIFFGPAVNAARGIAYQVNNIIQSFAQNFFAAVKPQIVMQYSLKNQTYATNLTFFSSKVGFFLMFLLASPLLFEMEYVLSVWLDVVPDKTIIFTRLVVINALIETINIPVVTAIQATGRIKSYQIIVAMLFFLNLPLSFIFLKVGFMAEVTIVISIVIACFSFFPRLIIAQKVANLPIKMFIKKVFLRVLLIVVCSLPVPLFLLYNYESSILRFALNSFFNIVINIGLIYYLGLSHSERKPIKNFGRKINLIH